MKIELRISPAHLYLVTPSDKSFLLWKWILWCIIWFSIWKWPFMLYDSCDSRGAPAPFHFMVGSSSGHRESESLIMSIFEKTHFTQANYICWYLDLWLLVSRESYYSSRTISGQPGITALPRITDDCQHNINIEQPLLLSLKPKLI